MSTFVSLKDVKDTLWICDDSDDARLWKILKATLDAVEKRIWNIQKGTKKETILKSMKMLRDGYLPFMICNVTKITKIDATDFSWKVAWTDYLLLDNWTAQVTDLMDFIVTDFDHFVIEYEAWYEKAPEDFIWAISALVWLEYAKDMARDVVEESTWPRTVKFSDPSRSQGWPDSARKAALKRLDKYIPLHLKMY